MWPAIGAAAMMGSLGLSINEALKGGSSAPDIGGELRSIRALYNEQREYAKSASREMLGAANKGTANRMALSGIYDSPVKEYVYGQNVKDSQTALAQALAGIAGQEGATRSSILNSLMGYGQQDALRQQQARNQLIAALGGLGAGMLMYGGKGGGAGVGATGYEGYNANPNFPTDYPINMGRSFRE